MTAAFDFARLACGDWERDRLWNWNAAAEPEVDVDLGVEAKSDLELELMVDVGVSKENDNNFDSGVALDALSGVGEGGMRLAFRDVRRGEGVWGA